MASPSERSSSSRSTTTLMPGRVVIVCDATKTLCAPELKHIITNIRIRETMIQEVDTITVLAVMHKVLHPMGFEMKIGPDIFIGTRVRAIEEQVSRLVDRYVRMLQPSAQECEDSGVVIEVKIVVGAPLKKAVVQEVVASNATWVVLNRHLKKELRFYLKHIPCKVAVTLDNFSLEILRPNYSDKATADIEHELFYSLSKIVPILPAEYSMNNELSTFFNGSLSSHESSDSEKSSSVSSLTNKSKEQSIYSPIVSQSKSHLDKSVSTVRYGKEKGEFDHSRLVMQEQRLQGEEKNLQLDSDAYHPSNEMKTCLDFKECDYSDIQIATNNFSSDNILGEDGYGVVYKGRLKNGKLIAVKVQKETNTQGFSEFHSLASALSLVCHKNIVILLGYSHRENLNILVYEYVSSRSLEWHLFDNTDHVLEWHRRQAIAVGIAKGLRFLHEECRGSPIVHRDLRPSNIFLTHEFTPLLANCGLGKWNTNKPNRKTNILGTIEYLAPEYAENGICSTKADVFAYGIVLIQLISGRKRGDLMTDNHHHSLRQWAQSIVFHSMPLIQTLALDKLVDHRLGGSYNTYELYQMAKVAYLCIQPKHSTRPTMGEVLHILEGNNEHLNKLVLQFTPHPSNVL